MISCSYSNEFLFMDIFVLVLALKCHVCSSDKMELCATLHFHSTNKVLPHELCAPDVTSCFTRIKGKLNDSWRCFFIFDNVDVESKNKFIKMIMLAFEWLICQVFVKPVRISAIAPFQQNVLVLLNT